MRTQASVRRKRASHMQRVPMITPTEQPNDRWSHGLHERLGSSHRQVVPNAQRCWMSTVASVRGLSRGRHVVDGQVRVAREHLGRLSSSKAVTPRSHH